ncbi:fatty acid-binding protein DegV [Exiguobacterium sp. KRL4]|uniref:DegV family protein n=1 Tax=Exiguobacterium sp. KRL4 TaxID=1914536 RepID=UPI0008F85302|nr:DegV family protein [Exiguobacterium sp. KRL4]OIN65857.1 fatty acid-binding protein DegV [Exiguobacterium sp. KRL4]
MKIAWITDSTTILPDSISARDDLTVVPLLVMKDGESFIDGVDVQAETVYEWIDAKHKVTTSQPSIGTFTEHYERLKEHYDIGFAIHLSSELSGTYNASIQGAEIAGFRLIAIDSRCGIYPAGQLLAEAMELAATGMPVEEIEQHILERRLDHHIEFTVANLNQLQAGGRISSTKAFVGNLLQLRPLFHFEDGKIVPYQTVRTFKKAHAKLYDHLVEMLESGTVTDVSLFHAAAYDLALEWKTSLEKRFDVTIRIDNLTPVLGSHTGNPAIGMSFLNPTSRR